MRDRRRELALSQLEVWQAGGPSNTTLTTIENGLAKSLPNATAKKLDRGLQWKPGSARRVWEGGEPASVVAGVEDVVAQVEASNLSAKTKAYILERLGTVTAPDPPPSDTQESGTGA